MISSLDGRIGATRLLFRVLCVDMHNKRNESLSLALADDYDSVAPVNDSTHVRKADTRV